MDQKSLNGHTSLKPVKSRYRLSVVPTGFCVRFDYDSKSLDKLTKLAAVFHQHGHPALRRIWFAAA